MGDSLPFLVMVLLQAGYAGMNILSKLAMNSGMNPLIHVAYRQIFAAVVLVPFAYFLESLTLNQLTYFVGLSHSTPTIACALTNLLPAVTFLMAVPCRLESVAIKSRSGQAKVVGTIVCVGGAMLLSFYHGSQVPIGESKIHWNYIIRNSRNSTNQTNHHNFMLGPFLLIASPVCWAVWFILQAKMSSTYPAPYSSSALMCLMASFQCGVVCNALSYCLMSWCIKRKGPLYVSVFSPFLLVIVAILSWALLEEKLYVGTVAGSGLIVTGLYTVLWGKKEEMISLANDFKIKHVEEFDIAKLENGDIEFVKCEK
uniref:WAT1-related protein n=1 Tax=Daucus carota subsp. sativus TaxID=79200 RepID=A0A175YFV6_DAUCS